MRRRVVLFEREGSVRNRRSFNADDGDQFRAGSDAERLETRAHDERRGRVGGGICWGSVEENCFREEGYAGLIRE